MPKTLADIKIRLYCQPPGTTGGGAWDWICPATNFQLASQHIDPQRGDGLSSRLAHVIGGCFDPFKKRKPR